MTSFLYFFLDPFQYFSFCLVFTRFPSFFFYYLPFFKFFYLYRYFLPLLAFSLAVFQFFFCLFLSHLFFFSFFHLFKPIVPPGILFIQYFSSFLFFALFISFFLSLSVSLSLSLCLCLCLCLSLYSPFSLDHLLQSLASPLLMIIVKFITGPHDLRVKTANMATVSTVEPTPPPLQVHTRPLVPPSMTRDYSLTLPTQPVLTSPKPSDTLRHATFQLSDVSDAAPHGRHRYGTA